MRMSLTQLWQAYQDKKEARNRAIVARMKLDMWIKAAIVYLRQLKTVNHDKYFNKLAELLLDYAHATYEPTELAVFLKDIAGLESRLREYDAKRETKEVADA